MAQKSHSALLIRILFLASSRKIVTKTALIGEIVSWLTQTVLINVIWMGSEDANERKQKPCDKAVSLLTVRIPIDQPNELVSGADRGII